MYLGLCQGRVDQLAAIMDIDDPGHRHFTERDIDLNFCTADAEGISIICNLIR